MIRPATYTVEPLSFDDPLEVAVEEVVTNVVYSAPETQSHVSMPTSQTHLLTPGSWTWQQIRDYVVNAITQTVGAFPRNPITEASIFKAFCERWGDMAERIARYAVEDSECWWKSAPLSVQRFCAGSDPYFATVIAARL
jgi:hypothetical protein